MMALLQLTCFTFALSNLWSIIWGAKILRLAISVAGVPMMWTHILALFSPPWGGRGQAKIWPVSDTACHTNMIGNVLCKFMNCVWWGTVCCILRTFQRMTWGMCCVTLLATSVFSICILSIFFVVVYRFLFLLFNV